MTKVVRANLKFQVIFRMAFEKELCARSLIESHGTFQKKALKARKKQSHCVYLFLQRLRVPKVVHLLFSWQNDEDCSERFHEGSISDSHP